MPAQSAILVLNPHWVIRWHHHHKTPGVNEGTFNSLLARAVDVGANDMMQEMNFAEADAQPAA
jgi:hypothetical protein